MTAGSPNSLFLDTSALYARFVQNAPRHDEAMAFFEAIHEGRARFRPLYTSSYVCSELATLLLRKAGHGRAMECLNGVRSSEAMHVLHPDEDAFERTCASFQRYDDQQISFVDHSIAVLADRHDVREIFAFDDDFRTFDLRVVPADLDVPS